eukprot:CAMPEP_0185202952 /NCGR_PEP_ID=MMETSP1140-20130426/52027_1 /TAXON_ID=298111 /ORGANISM="Pavlova sp., Strain CCMP459" /LENGTH=100 /DNA_ID=CAMNT_0027770429 /DNA_START=119 /DNA_END=421 /DNA_ORIENTATION=-
MGHVWTTLKLPPSRVSCFHEVHGARAHCTFSPRHERMHLLNGNEHGRARRLRGGPTGGACMTHLALVPGGACMIHLALVAGARNSHEQHMLPELHFSQHP